MKSILFVLVVPCAMFVSCGARSQAHIMLPENADYRSGDLVLRCGYGAESRAVTYGGQSVYSHIGMLVFDDSINQWMVVHAVPGETREDEPEYIKYEAIEKFFASDRACKGAWMRVQCADSVAAHAAAYCLNKYNDSVLFDNAYLLDDTTELYCCELVWRAYLNHGIDITSGNRHAIPTLFCAEAEGIFPSDIEKSDKTIFVKPFNFVPL